MSLWATVSIGFLIWEMTKPSLIFANGPSSSKVYSSPLVSAPHGIWDQDGCSHNSNADYSNPSSPGGWGRYFFLAQGMGSMYLE